jgi:hypothetical protein
MPCPRAGGGAKGEYKREEVQYLDGHIKGSECTAAVICKVVGHHVQRLVWERCVVDSWGPEVEGV